MSIDTKDTAKNKKTLGIFYGIMAYASWGLLPMYWKLLDAAPAMEILAHRMLWSCFFTIFLIFITKKREKFISVFKDWNKIKYIFISAFIITVNWFTYIWAVNSNHIIESSLGYYINPLITVLLGIIVFKERPEKKQYIAILLAVSGVAVMTIQYGKIPYVSLILAISFALYGLFKKISGVESSVSLAVETTLLAPIAFIYIIYRQISGIGIIGNISAITTILLLCTGVATAVPLLWFSKSAKRLEMSTLGFLQFLSPSISLVLGILVYGEEFTKTHLVSFSLIWVGLLIYTISITSSKKEISTQTN